MLGEESILNTRYYLEKKIGQGGFAKVFLATDTLLKRKVAIKLLNPELVDNEDFLSRFEGEAQSVAGLEHPNILGIYDYGRIEDTAFLVMPYIEGGTLYQKLRLDKKFSLPEANYYLQQLTAALDYAHRRNIVHRDIKPQNMLVRAEDNRLFLADFGIAKVLSSNTSHHSTQAVGTPSYMAPEQLQGSIGIGTDIYALGCVLFQMLTGETPFLGSPEQVITGHLWRPVPSITTRSHGDIPDVLQPLFDKALAKRIEDRFQSAGEMALVYQALISGGISVTTPIVAPYNPQFQPTNPLIKLATGPQPNTSPVQGQWASSPAVVASGNTPLPNVNPTIPTNTPLPTLEKNRSKKGILAAIGGLIGLAIAVTVLIIALASNNPTPQAQATPTSTVIPTLNVAGLKEANDQFFVKGEFAAGLQKLKGLTETFPTNAAAWRDYGHALHFWTRDNNDGIEQLQKAAQLDPKDALTQLYLTDALLDNYRFGEAETVANNTAKLDTDGWMGHAALTTLYSRTARFAKARSELDLMQKAGGKATTDPYFNWIEGNSWYYSTEYPNYGQNYTAAYKFFDRTIMEWPNVPSVIGIRSFLFALSDYKINGASSLTKIEDMTKIQPKSSRLYSYLAHMNLFFENNDIKAERYAQQALEVNDANPQARLVLGGLEGRTKNYTVSYDYYERCVATDPYQDQCFADWANFLADNSLEEEVAGKTSEAQRLRQIGLDKAKKAVSIAPTHYFWIYRLGYFYTLLRDYKNGVEQLEKAVSMRQDVAVTYALLGLAYNGNGQRDKAQSAYDAGNKLDPTDFWVRRLGDTLAGKQ